MNEILVGAIAMGSLVAGMFFLRYWKTTRDRFFLYFALSFFIEAFNRIYLGADMQSEHARQSTFYILRLIAYGLILFAIWDKNRPRDKGK
jgi:quinol-cytochrome oxidoreductase complex cytochrome b subunit